MININSDNIKLLNNSNKNSEQESNKESNRSNLEA